MIQLDTLTLPDGLDWPDEFDTSAIGQSVRRRLDGGLVVYPRALAAGRSITLVAPNDQPLTRAQAAALEALAAVVGASYALTLRDESFQVMFRHHDPPALDLTPLVDYADPIDSDFVVGTVKLFTV
ncbi:hypothetical protein [Thiocystis violascens]|uniref:Uncharacterized protein n=1 Tax=Thiocystis violascens (strain ATCC 17096 / DSM 198 / 6111) TaxID=765911 RepID=I3YGX5_THIV6|nr:hypothetical protein [Thiocystis violascens]AFL76243.1 hypothetical protein Thivi_4441 [Thiocystis violascens DSM 198]